jgi:hypothetical protein
MKKQEAIELVNKGIGSFYSKEDVINLINQIEESKTETPSFDGQEIVKSVMNEWHDKVHDIFDDLANEIESNDIVDMNECGFYLEHDNTIVLNEVSFETYEIQNRVEDCRDSLAEFVSKAIVDACTPKEEEDTSIDEQVEQGEQEQNEQ